MTVLQIKIKIKTTKQFLNLKNIKKIPFTSISLHMNKDKETKIGKYKSQKLSSEIFFKYQNELQSHLTL